MHNIAIITSQYNAYQDYLNSQEKDSEKSYIWVNCIDKIRGKRFNKVVRIHPYYNIDEIQNILDYIDAHLMPEEVPYGRSMQELLNVMLDNQALFTVGMCSWNRALAVAGHITGTESIRLHSYINANRPGMFSSIGAFKNRKDDYFWEKREIEPRILWIKQHIKKKFLVIERQLHTCYKNLTYGILKHELKRTFS